MPKKENRSSTDDSIFETRNTCASQLEQIIEVTQFSHSLGMPSRFQTWAKTFLPLDTLHAFGCTETPSRHTVHVRTINYMLRYFKTNRMVFLRSNWLTLTHKSNMYIIKEVREVKPHQMLLTVHSWPASKPLASPRIRGNSLLEKNILLSCQNEGNKTHECVAA